MEKQKIQLLGAEPKQFQVLKKISVTLNLLLSLLAGSMHELRLVAAPRIGIFGKLSKCSPFLFSSLSYMQESFNCGGKTRRRHAKKWPGLTNFSPPLSWW